MGTLYVLDNFPVHRQEGFHAPLSEGDTVHLFDEDYIVVDKTYNPLTNELKITIDFI